MNVYQRCQRHRCKKRKILKQIFFSYFVKGSDQRENRRVWSNINTRYLICYHLVTCRQRRLVCTDVCSARTSRRYQNRKFTMPSQFGIVGAANWQRRLVCAEHTSAHTITSVTHSQRRLVGAANFGSTDYYAVLHDITTHDKLFQHILVGATSTSALTSRQFQCLQKNSFAHFLWVICSKETYGRVHMAQQYLVYHRVCRVLVSVPSSAYI